jgi:hypothetical protein
LIGLLETLGPTARVTTVRSTPESRDAGADLVFSLGRPMWSPEQVGDDLPILADAVGVTWAPLDGSFARAWAQDPDNLAREVALVSSGHSDAHVTVFAGPGARSRLAESHDVARGLLSSPSLEVETRDLFAELTTTTVSEPDSAWNAVRVAAHLATRTGGLRELAALERTARGPVVAVRDPVLGTRWLSVRAC